MLLQKGFYSIYCGVPHPPYNTNLSKSVVLLHWKWDSCCKMNLTVTSPGRAQNMERFLWPRSVQFVSFRVPDERVTSSARSWIEA